MMLSAQLEVSRDRRGSNMRPIVLNSRSLAALEAEIANSKKSKLNKNFAICWGALSKSRLANI